MSDESLLRQSWKLHDSGKSIVTIGPSRISISYREKMLIIKVLKS